MDVIFWLIPLSIAILILAVVIFFWAVRSGQFQDLDSPAVDILFDEVEQAKDNTSINASNESQLNESQPNEHSRNPNEK